MEWWNLQKTDALLNLFTLKDVYTSKMPQGGKDISNQEMEKSIYEADYPII